jgi:hypothetical protein
MAGTSRYLCVHFLTGNISPNSGVLLILAYHLKLRRKNRYQGDNALGRTDGPSISLKSKNNLHFMLGFIFY